jgi:hypothetical protein
MCLKPHAGVCHVAGFGDVSASPWPPRPALVPRRGTVLDSLEEMILQCL